jgi:hypothetical protein
MRRSTRWLGLRRRDFEPLVRSSSSVVTSSRGKADGHLRGEAELAAFVVGDQSLDDADPLGEFS